MATLLFVTFFGAAWIDDTGVACLLGGDGDTARNVSTIEMLIFVGSHSSMFRREAASLYCRGSPWWAPG